MSLFDCIQRAMDDTGEDGINADRARGERAQKQWRETADRYEADGHPRHTAEALAADDVKEAFRREAGEKRHVYLSVAGFQRKAQAAVGASDTPNMRDRMTQMDYQHRGLVRRFNGRMAEYLKKHHRDLLGRTTNPAELAHLADELHGISTGNPNAKALADGIRDALEDMRLMFNEAGGLTSKLDNWGLPHTHDRASLRRAGRETWARQIYERLDWDRINDPLTGRNLPDEAARMRYLSEVYDDIVFGKAADDAVYGRPKGVATYRKHMDQRSLHFKSGQDWMDYNKQFGTGDMHTTLMSHVHRMARDITLMREFGPNPKLGVEYEADLWAKKIKGNKDEAMINRVASDTEVAKRMMNVMSGGTAATEPWMQWLATFGSTARNLMTSAFLDRAIIASISDMNTMRMAAKSMGMNEFGPLQRQVGMLPSLSKDELARAGWVADTMADAGSAMARFQQEHAPKEWAERVSQMSMRLQGLSAWTDRGRATAYQEFSGHMAKHMDQPRSGLPPELRIMFDKWGVSDADWDEFRRPENLFTSESGATFLMPIYFRNSTKMSPQAADRLFFKMMGATEEFIELSVPTKSLIGQAWTDPSAVNLPPGHPLYEIAKSGLMFKSFPITFTINQYRQIQSKGGFMSAGGLGYAFDLAAGATLMGAVALQVGDVLMGRDPQDMTDPMFWARAGAKGGGFAILGDIVTTGQASWGGGFGSYFAGPVPQAMDDVWGVTLGPAITKLWAEATGEEVDLNYAQKLARFGKRYTPMGQTPIIGPALDRNLWDRLQLYLDPDSIDALERATRNRKNLTGGGEFWPAGSPTPTRGPDFSTALGG